MSKYTVYLGTTTFCGEHPVKMKNLAHCGATAVARKCRDCIFYSNPERYMSDTKTFTLPNAHVLRRLLCLSVR